MRCKKQNKTETSGLLENNWSDSRFRNQKEANDRLKREDKKRRREQVRIFGVLGSIGGHFGIEGNAEKSPIVPTFIVGWWLNYVKLEKKIGESQRQRIPTVKEYM